MQGVMQGVTFGIKHSYREWGLIMKSRPVISPPKPKTKLIQIPGSDKVIDLTESLTGAVHYEPRTVSCEFIVADGRHKWPAVYSAVLESVHGKRLQIIMDDDPNYYYEGRVSVDEWQSEEVTSTIVITAEVEPFKRSRFGSEAKL